MNKLIKQWRKMISWFSSTHHTSVLKFRDSRISTNLNKPIVFILPYAILFSLFILLPTIISSILSLTYFNTIEKPAWLGFDNYVNLFTSDSVFLQSAIGTTLKYAVIVGPIGYILSFSLAWMLGQVTHRARIIYTLLIYSPSITGGVMMNVVWQVIFSGDEAGHLNHLLLNLGVIHEPVVFLQNTNLLFPIMILIALWSSAGIGFLAMSAGILNVDRTLYEAANIDGIKNRWQEVFYITIPMMKPQMLFGAVMAIVSAFNVAGVASALSGGNPPPQYTGWMIMDHANDFGFIRYEMGYASTITVVLFIIVFIFNRISYKLFANNDD